MEPANPHAHEDTKSDISDMLNEVPEIPPTVPAWLRARMESSYAHVTAMRARLDQAVQNALYDMNQYMTGYDFNMYGAYNTYYDPGGIIISRPDGLANRARRFLHRCLPFVNRSGRLYDTRRRLIRNMDDYYGDNHVLHEHRIDLENIQHYGNGLMVPYPQFESMHRLARRLLRENLHLSEEQINAMLAEFFPEQVNPAIQQPQQQAVVEAAVQAAQPAQNSNLQQPQVEAGGDFETPDLAAPEEVNPAIQQPQQQAGEPPENHAPQGNNDNIFAENPVQNAQHHEGQPSAARRVYNPEKTAREIVAQHLSKADEGVSKFIFNHIYTALRMNPFRSQEELEKVIKDAIKTLKSLTSQAEQEEQQPREEEQNSFNIFAENSVQNGSQEAQEYEGRVLAARQDSDEDEMDEIPDERQDSLSPYVASPYILHVAQSTNNQVESLGASRGGAVAGRDAAARQR